MAVGAMAKRSSEPASKRERERKKRKRDGRGRARVHKYCCRFQQLGNVPGAIFLGVRSFLELRLSKKETIRHHFIALSRTSPASPLQGWHTLLTRTGIATKQ